MYVGFAGLFAGATDAAAAKVSAITETSVIQVRNPAERYIGKTSASSRLKSFSICLSIAWKNALSARNDRKDHKPTTALGAASHGYRLELHYTLRKNPIKNRILGM